MAWGSRAIKVYTMAKEWAKGFYNSSRWIKCRQSFIDQRIMIDVGMCQECHKVPGEIVHHKIILTDENINDESISLSFDNLEFVCHKCHDEFEGHGVHGNGKIKPLCIFAADGQPVSLRDIDRKGFARSGIPPG